MCQPNDWFIVPKMLRQFNVIRKAMFVAWLVPFGDLVFFIGAMHADSEKQLLRLQNNTFAGTIASMCTVTSHAVGGATIHIYFLGDAR